MCASSNSHDRRDSTVASSHAKIPGTRRTLLSDQFTVFRGMTAVPLVRFDHIDRSVSHRHGQGPAVGSLPPVARRTTASNGGSTPYGRPVDVPPARMGHHTVSLLRRNPVPRGTAACRTTSGGSRFSLVQQHPSPLEHFLNHRPRHDSRPRSHHRICPVPGPIKNILCAGRPAPSSHRRLRRHWPPQTRHSASSSPTPPPPSPSPRVSVTSRRLNPTFGGTARRAWRA